MKKTAALRRLKSLGTAQNRKVYGRHGVTGTMFGVSYANLYEFQKEIGADHELAAGLWASGNHDARVLACLIEDPERVTAKQLDAWVREVDNHVLGNSVAELAAKTPACLKHAARWTAAKTEWASAAGWNLTSRLAQDEECELDDAHWAEQIERIEAGIHAAPNRTRYSMNSALIGIGVRNAKLRKLAVAAAKRIGPVEVDHGETSCKTPDAVSYIAKTVEQRRAKAARAKQKAGKRQAARKKTAKKAAAGAKRTAGQRAARS